jgi:cell division septal protein FtsQ
MRWRFKKANRRSVRKRGSHRPRFLMDRLAKWALPSVAGASLLLAVWLGVNLFRSNHWFAITQIVAEGEFKHLTPLQVISLLPVRKGDNLLLADLDRCVQNLYRHPWIKEARLKREYPHTLVVWVLEEDPVAILSGPHYTYINHNGRPFKDVEKGDNMDFPLFVLPARAQLSSPDATSEKTVHEMIDFLNKYEQTRFALEFGVSELVAEEGEFVVFTKKGKLQVRLSRNARDRDATDAELYKLDRYYPDILVAQNRVGVLNLQVKGKIIASAKN